MLSVKSPGAADVDCSLCLNLCMPEEHRQTTQKTNVDCCLLVHLQAGVQSNAIHQTLMNGYDMKFTFDFATYAKNQSCDHHQPSNTDMYIHTSKEMRDEDFKLANLSLLKLSR